MKGVALVLTGLSLWPAQASAQAQSRAQPLAVSQAVSQADPLTASPAPCGDLLAGVPSTTPPRTITPDDLLRLREIGHPDGSLFGQPSPLGVSPDGRTLAFVINRADPARNSYCRALVTMPVDGRGAPHVADTGGELITMKLVTRGLDVPGGSPAIVTPAWSPDGQWIAYLRRDGGRTQVWRVRADGAGAQMVTHEETDVLAVAWSADSAGAGRIVYQTQPRVPERQAAIDREGAKGWLYDASVIPYFGARPYPAQTPREPWSIDPDGSGRRVASARERMLVSTGDDNTPAISVRSSAGWSATTAHAGGGILAPLELSVQRRTGTALVCRDSACRGGFTGLWWDGDTLVFLRREGWANGAMGLYRWKPGMRRPWAILHTADVLQGCLQNGEELLCTRENATSPKRIAAINLRTGRSREIYDPNPEFRRLNLGTVERLPWKNDAGLEAWGDLVLPPGYTPGTRLPMIVVQYHSDGFLRGGTGDEYPIFAFAARGFAVLSVERAAPVGSNRPEFKTYQQLDAFGLKDWAERRSLLSSLETGVRIVIDRGIADPARIGVTGLSDGATSVRFALINSKMFSVAALSTCCVEPDTAAVYGGIGFADQARAMGYPLDSRDDSAFWSPVSITRNAGRIDQPLLMQLSDDEFLTGISAYMALRAAGKPIEMYVFPGEHHVKWQPAHRAAIYERNLDWFSFWLQGRIDPDPAKRAVFARWEAMRDRRKPSEGTAGTQ